MRRETTWTSERLENTLEWRKEKTYMYVVCAIYTTWQKNRKERKEKYPTNMNHTQGCQTYPIFGYNTPFCLFVPQKNLYPWGTYFVPHLDFWAFAAINWSLVAAELKIRLNCKMKCNDFFYICSKWTWINQMCSEWPKVYPCSR